MPCRAFVLAITLRPAKLCATQDVLQEQGIHLLTVTSFAAGRLAIHRFGIEAVIVCHHSWSAEERDILARELAAVRPPVKFVMRCPGCIDCDEAAGVAGVLTDATQVDALISTVLPASAPVNRSEADLSRGESE